MWWNGASPACHWAGSRDAPEEITAEGGRLVNAKRTKQDVLIDPRPGDSFDLRAYMCPNYEVVRRETVDRVLVHESGHLSSGDRWMDLSEFVALANNPQFPAIVRSVAQADGTTEECGRGEGS